MFFIQMSGFPGSGKSTLSREIAKQLKAVIVDHDIVKSSLMESLLDVPIDPRLAGRVSYNIDWSLVDFYLSQGHNVILDSPCLYDELIEKGITLSEKYQVKYKYVECYLNDMKEVNRRLQNRQKMISQIQKVSSLEGFHNAIANSKKPLEKKILIVDTSKPIETYLQEVVNYIKI